LIRVTFTCCRKEGDRDGSVALVGLPGLEDVDERRLLALHAENLIHDSHLHEPNLLNVESLCCTGAITSLASVVRIANVTGAQKVSTFIVPGNQVGGSRSLSLCRLANQNQCTRV
jgi:hypothetical protein